MKAVHCVVLALLLAVACRSDQQGGGTAPLPEPALPALRLVLAPDTGTLVRASLVITDGAALSVGAFTVQVAYDTAQLRPVDWSANPGGMLMGSDAGGSIRLAGISAEGVPGSNPLAVLRFAWPGRAPNALPSLFLDVPELADAEGASLKTKVTVTRGAAWQ